nr:src activatable repoter rBSRwt [synthetic construct]
MEQKLISEEDLGRPKLARPKKIIFVGHDWGACLAFHYSYEHQDKIKAIVHAESVVDVIESWDEWPDIEEDIALIKSEEGEKMVLENNFFVETMLPSKIMRKLEPEEFAAYLEPFKEKGEVRRPTLSWPREIPLVKGGKPDVVQIVRNYNAYLRASDDLPKMFIESDPGFFSNAIVEGAKKFPNTEFVKVKGLHFSQEDAPDEMGKYIKSFVERVLKNEQGSGSWFHGKLSRREAEALLQLNGDFLVRESTTTPGQYVLTGLQSGQPKHLLLVDPEGVVRTKDHRFESVSHLISYHMDNHLPIISAGSELCLQQPVSRGGSTSGSGKPGSGEGSGWMEDYDYVHLQGMTSKVYDPEQRKRMITGPQWWARCKQMNVLDSFINYYDSEKHAENAVIFLHGNAASSYLWRHVVPHIEPVARCIIPDLIGMGKSGKSGNGSYRLLDYYKYLTAWFELLNL